MSLSSPIASLSPSASTSQGTCSQCRIYRRRCFFDADDYDGSKETRCRPCVENGDSKCSIDIANLSLKPTPSTISKLVPAQWPAAPLSEPLMTIKRELVEPSFISDRNPPSRKKQKAEKYDQPPSSDKPPSSKKRKIAKSDSKHEERIAFLEETIAKAQTYLAEELVAIREHHRKEREVLEKEELEKRRAMDAIADDVALMEATNARARDAMLTRHIEEMKRLEDSQVLARANMERGLGDKTNGLLKKLKKAEEDLKDVRRRIGDVDEVMKTYETRRMKAGVVLPE